MSVNIKAGDTAPAQRKRLKGRDGPADLSGATVVMQVRGREGVSFDVDIDDAQNGVVFVPRGDLEANGNRPVTYDVEFEVTYADGSIQTFPEPGYEQVTVWPDLDDK
jgi:hypothetical protein